MMTFNTTVMPKIIKIPRWVNRIMQSMRFCIYQNEYKNPENTVDLPNINWLQWQYEKQNGLCYWLQIPMNIEESSRLDSISLDRLDSSLPYTQNNCVLCTKFANMGKGRHTVDDMRQFVALLGIKMNEPIVEKGGMDVIYF